MKLLLKKCQPIFCSLLFVNSFKPIPGKKGEVVYNIHKNNVKGAFILKLTLLASV
jgi:hypothetical protein